MKVNIETFCTREYRNSQDDWMVNVFFQVPNAAGFLFGTIQLVLYAIYRRSKGSEQVSDDLEDAWQHEQLLPSSSPNVP